MMHAENHTANHSEHQATSPPFQTRHAVILAAGESTRTRPLTLHRPKPLIPLLGRPILARILDELVGLVTDVTLVVGYRAEAIQNYFGSSYQGISLHYVLQRETNGTAGALLAVARQAEASIQQPFFLLYGDNLISRIDLLDLPQHRYNIVGGRVANAQAFGVLNIVDGQVKGVLEKPAHPPPNAVINLGIYHFDAQVVPLLEEIRPSSRGEYELTDLIALLAREHPIHCQMARGYWIPIGTPWDVLLASMFLLRRGTALREAEAFAPSYPDCHLRGFLHIAPSQLGPNTTIIGPTYIAEGVQVGADCLIEHAVLEAGAVVEEQCRITKAVIGSGARIGAGSLVLQSIVDERAHIGTASTLIAYLDARVPIPEAIGVPESTRWHGVIVGPGVVLPAQTIATSGTIFFPQNL